MSFRESLRLFTPRTALAGLAAGFFSQAAMGAVFLSPPVQALLYNPAYQSELFRTLTPTRNVAYSVAGLIALSAAHAWLFRLVQESLPPGGRVRRGLTFGVWLWVLYWVPQEWFIYHTLLGEPLWLCAVELAIVLGGSMFEGVLIALGAPDHANKTV